MPPPFQQNTGSKAALVTWTVITSILFVVATVLAIFAYLDRNNVVTERDTLVAKYGRVMSESEFNGDLKTQLEGAAAADPDMFAGSPSLVRVATIQRDALAKALSGAGKTAPAALADARTALATAARDAKITADNAVGATNALLAQYTAAQAQLKQLTTARDDLNKKIAAVNADFKMQLASKDAEIGKAREQAGAYQSEVTGVRSDKDKQIQDALAAAEAQTKLAQDDVNRLQAQVQEAANNAKKQEAVVAALQSKLRETRVGVSQISRQADAKVIRVGSDGVVFIDLGAGDQVTAGMSFEVFDRIEGIPQIGPAETDENLPKGKASIELVKVSPGASQGRVIRTTPGMTLVEGDLCVNVVYDRNVKYNFVVYGSFDLDRNNQPTPSDADVIKRLVTQWGGVVQDKLTVDTDFLVIGKVPEIPSYTQEELDRPEVQFEIERKKQELTAYDDILSRAIALNIPVLNQNRFLYFTGYYEQSGR
ncbi:MAG TPA: hypothetical protein VF624_08130 [Tepidisphaeraceae bacterium]|jgi:hypothetical protein